MCNFTSFPPRVEESSPTHFWAVSHQCLPHFLYFSHTLVSWICLPFFCCKSSLTSPKLHFFSSHLSLNYFLFFTIPFFFLFQLVSFLLSVKKHVCITHLRTMWQRPACDTTQRPRWRVMWCDRSRKPRVRGSLAVAEAAPGTLCLLKGPDRFFLFFWISQIFDIKLFFIRKK